MLNIIWEQTQHARIPTTFVDHSHAGESLPMPKIVHAYTTQHASDTAKNLDGKILLWI